MLNESPLEKASSFPDAFTWDITKFLLANLGDENLYEAWRPPRPIDPSGSIAVIAQDVEPKIWEIGGYGPTVECYAIDIWAFTKNASVAHGQQERSVLAKKVRRLVAASRELREILSQNVDEFDGSIERFLKLTFVNQRLRANEVAGDNIFISITRFEIETETV